MRTMLLILAMSAAAAAPAAKKGQAYDYTYDMECPVASWASALVLKGRYTLHERRLYADVQLAVAAIQAALAEGEYSARVRIRFESLRGTREYLSGLGYDVKYDLGGVKVREVDTSPVLLEISWDGK